MLQREALIIIIIVEKKFTDLLVPRLCPLVIAVKVDWRQGRCAGSKGKVMGIKLLDYVAGKRSSVMRLNVVSKLLRNK
jgi:hypothetical protein